MLMVTLLSSLVSNIIFPLSDISKSKAEAKFIYASLNLHIEDCASQILSFGVLQGHLVLFFLLC